MTILQGFLAKNFVRKWFAKEDRTPGRERAVRIVALWLMLGLGAGATQAAVLPFPMNTEFSGGTEPQGTKPWITATFDDGGTAGSVTLTLSNANLINTEYVSEWYFNLDPALTVTNLAFGNLVKSGTFADPTVNLQTDGFKANGDGDFDIKIDFSTAEAERFGVGEWLTYDITGISTLTADSFDFLSAVTGNKVGQPAAAHVPISSGISGWITIPEPTTLGLLVAGSIVVLLRRWR